MPASAKPRGLSEELQKETWYHKGASKETAEELLNKSVNGSFLVRDGESAAEVCSLSLKYPGGIKHFRILKNTFWALSSTWKSRFSDYSRVD